MRILHVLHFPPIFLLNHRLTLFSNTVRNGPFHSHPPVEMRGASNTTIAPAYLHKLSTEVWEYCWAYCSNRQLQSLVLVCRLFRDICHPLLFSDLEFSAPDVESISEENWKDSDQYIVSERLRLLQIARSRHAWAVHRLDFLGCFELDLVWLYPTVPEIYSLQTDYLATVETLLPMLHAFQQLRQVHLCELTVDESVRTALCALPRLTDLTLDVCDITSRISPLLPLRRFALSGDVSDSAGMLSPLHIVSSKYLHTLDLQSWEEGASTLASFRPGEAFRNLVDLTIAVSDDIASTFFVFLADCPMLERLDLLSTPSLVHPHRVPAATIPLLNSFHGSLHLVMAFVCGRPVDALTVTLDRPPGDQALDVLPELESVLLEIAQNPVRLKILRLPRMPPGLSIFTRREPWPQASDVEDQDSSEDGEIPEEERDDASPHSRSYYFIQSHGVTIRVLRKEAAADPDQHFASIEVDIEGLPKRLPLSFAGVMDWICLGHAIFPPNLAVLEIRQLSGAYVAPYTVPQQCRALVTLSRHLPRLEAARLGNYCNYWKREDGVWRSTIF
ncbi:hypothetical protein C8J57DRAFT_1359885 [Mycena rebaudengoi]|nr:hypothetical protein C8J57DRAFT_1359885 [Mycena rebaudengoi]